MAKSKKINPPFNRRATPAEPEAITPVEPEVIEVTPESEAIEAAPESDAAMLVIDVVPLPALPPHPVDPPEPTTAAAPIPISRALIVRPRPRPISGLERGIELLSRPFGVVFMLVVAGLGGLKTRRTLLLLIAVGTLASTACNRAEAIWSGVEFQEDGRLKLAAEDPMCGCLAIANISGKDLALHSLFHGSTVGNTSMKAGEKLKFRFDWAGPENDDVYIVEGHDAQGNEVSLKTAVRVEENVRWESCSTAACPYGELLLNMGETGR